MKGAPRDGPPDLQPPRGRRDHDPNGTAPSDRRRCGCRRVRRGAGRRGRAAHPELRPHGRRAAVRGMGERLERHARRQPGADLAVHRLARSRPAAAGRHPGRHRPDPPAQHPRPAGLARDAAAAGRAPRAERRRQRPRCRQGGRRSRRPATATTCSPRAGPARSSTRPARPRAGKQQVAMGLAGAIVVLPATAGQAYGSATTAYDDEAVMVLSEVDPALNTARRPGRASTSARSPRATGS